jgi:hypothetical protein
MRLLGRFMLQVVGRPVAAGSIPACWALWIWGIANTIKWSDTWEDAAERDPTVLADVAGWTLHGGSVCLVIVGGLFACLLVTVACGTIAFLPWDGWGDSE